MKNFIFLFSSIFFSASASVGMSEVELEQRNPAIPVPVYVPVAATPPNDKDLCRENDGGSPEAHISPKNVNVLKGEKND